MADLGGIFTSVHFSSSGSSQVALVIKNLPASVKRHKRCKFDPCVGKILWRRKWYPAPVFLPGKSHGQRSQVGYGPWVHRETWLSIAHTHSSSFLKSFSLQIPVLFNGTNMVAQKVKHLPAVQETWVRFLDQEDPLEKEMATHCNTLAWKIPRTEEPRRLQSMGSQRVGHDWPHIFRPHIDCVSSSESHF